jgi:hypothetical protein
MVKTAFIDTSAFLAALARGIGFTKRRQKNGHYWPTTEASYGRLTMSGWRADRSFSDGWVQRR